MQGNVLGQSGAGSKIKGLIEEYQVADGEKIKAGDFVATALTNEIDTKINDEIKSTGYTLCQLAIDEQRLLILTSMGNGIKGMILSIDNNILQVKSNILLIIGLKNTNEYNSVTLIKISKNKYLILYYIGNKLQGMIISINNFDINIENTIEIANKTPNSYNLIVKKMLKNKIFLSTLFNEKSTQNLHGMIIKIENETEVKVENDTIIGTNNGYSGSAIIINDEKIILITSNNSANSSILGMIIDGKDMSIIQKSKALISPKSFNGYLKSIKITNNRILIVYKGDNSKSNATEYKLYGVIAKIENLEIKINNVVILTDISRITDCIKVLKINQNQVVVCYTSGADYTTDKKYNGKVLILTVSDTSIASDEFYQLDNDFDDNRLAITRNRLKDIYILHYSDKTNKYLMELIFHTKIKKESRIDGVAKTSGKSRDTIKVIVPNYEEEEGE